MINKKQVAELRKIFSLVNPLPSYLAVGLSEDSYKSTYLRKFPGTENFVIANSIRTHLKSEEKFIKYLEGLELATTFIGCDSLIITHRTSWSRVDLLLERGFDLLFNNHNPHSGNNVCFLHKNLEDRDGESA